MDWEEWGEASRARRRERREAARAAYREKAAAQNILSPSENATLDEMLASLAGDDDLSDWDQRILKRLIGRARRGASLDVGTFTSRFDDPPPGHFDGWSAENIAWFAADRSWAVVDATPSEGARPLGPADERVHRWCRRLKLVPAPSPAHARFASATFPAIIDGDALTVAQYRRELVAPRSRNDDAADGAGVPALDADAVFALTMEEASAACMVEFLVGGLAVRAAQIPRFLPFVVEPGSRWGGHDLGDLMGVFLVAEGEWEFEACAEPVATDDVSAEEARAQRALELVMEARALGCDAQMRNAVRDAVRDGRNRCVVMEQSVELGRAIAAGDDSDSTRVQAWALLPALDAGAALAAARAATS